MARLTAAQRVARLNSVTPRTTATPTDPAACPERRVRDVADAL